ncbi:MAG TPA: hypothetical protein PK867_07145 [Pirellulales bacterium]|nr:hypothetical protein [Pirellulales bacterium]
MSQYLFSGVSEQAKAAKHRMDDARALFNATRWRGAMYLAGYSLECLLKVKLARDFLEAVEAISRWVENP